ncbi:MAG TPA: class I SAM-dependent methyltransferase [Ktedonobacterales bacterium]|nr:class I SAM-dependent methyltransferase [Ktedonobacterales bacterium]
MGDLHPARDAYSFDPFARQPFYTDVNRSLVRRAVARLAASRPAGAPLLIVDLAAGTGAVTRLILEELATCGRAATIIGIEPSPEAIAIARADLAGHVVEFIEGNAADLPRIAPEADAVFFCNAIHLLPDKAATLDQIAGVLRPGGILAANSTFFIGAQTPEGDRFALMWIRRAIGWLREHHPEARASRKNAVPTVTWLSAAEYADLFEAHHLRVLDRELEVVPVPVEAVRAIGRYWLFIEGALPGVPIPIGAEALDWAGGETGRELGVAAIPRTWLQLVAERSASE